MPRLWFDIKQDREEEIKNKVRDLCPGAAFEIDKGWCSVATLALGITFNGPGFGKAMAYLLNNVNDMFKDDEDFLSSD